MTLIPVQTMYRIVSDNYNTVIMDILFFAVFVLILLTIILFVVITLNVKWAIPFWHPFNIGIIIICIMGTAALTYIYFRDFNTNLNNKFKVEITEMQCYQIEGKIYCPKGE